MYFSDFTPTDIEGHLSIPLNQIRSIIFGEDQTGNDPLCLFQLKRDMEDEGKTSVKIYERMKDSIILSAEASLIRSINRSIHNLAGKDSMELDDITKAVTMYEKIHKIRRLEQGEVTEVIGVDTSGFSMREILIEQRKINPILDAEYSDLSNKKLEDKVNELNNSDNNSDNLE